MTATAATAATSVAAERLADNPFFVLGLPPDAAPREVEREAQKLLGMLELGLADVASYATPLGPRPRTPERVRAAAAALRDPRRRLVAELWATGAAIAAPVAAAAAAVGDADAGAVVGATDETTTDTTTDRWPGALARAGWGPRRGREERG